MAAPPQIDDPAPPGSPPGTLSHAIPKTAAATARRWSAGAYTEDAVGAGDLPAVATDAWLWIDVAGMSDPRLLEAIGERYDLHPLPLEDVLDPRQRPKVEDYDDCLFVVLDTLSPGEPPDRGRVALFLGDRFVISFHDEAVGCLEPVRERLRSGRGRIRDHGVDYLAYALIDAVVDHYYPVLDEFDETLESLEDEVLEARSTPIKAVRKARQSLQAIRHAIWPAREVVATLLRDTDRLISADTRTYLRDCYDHLTQLVDMVERSREISANLLDIYISGVSLETNRSMKVLTLIATVFIPLTFITGIYGMNFDPSRSPLNMPELRWFWGYPFALGLMVATAVGLLLFFRRRRWL